MTDRAGPGEAIKGLVNETKITLLTQRGLYYRGGMWRSWPRHRLSSPLPALLVGGRSRDVFGKSLPAAPPSYAKLRRGLAELPVVERRRWRCFPLIERGQSTLL